MNFLFIHAEIVRESPMCRIHFAAGAAGRRMHAIRLHLGLSVIAREPFDHRPASVGAAGIIKMGDSSQILFFKCRKLIPDVPDVDRLHDSISLWDRHDGMIAVWPQVSLMLGKLAHSMLW